MAGPQSPFLLLTLPRNKPMILLIESLAACALIAGVISML
jgi:hypothetical protein